MFAEQRMEIIKDILREKKHVNVSVLSEALNVSDVTIRKYLDILERKGFLQKVHGGAILLEDHSPMLDAESADDVRLRPIAKLAATLVNESDSIFIGPGFTCAALARQIAKKPNVSVITNNFLAANYLMNKVAHLIFIGGDIDCASDPGAAYTCGSKTRIFLENMAISKAFISCDGIDMGVGITIQSLSCLEMVRNVLDISRDLYVMSFSNKFGRVAMNRLCAMSAPKSIITDSNLPDEYKRYCYEHNIKLLMAYPKYPD